MGESDYNNFITNLIQQVVSLLLVVKHVNIEFELELVTTYYIKFIVKLL